MSKEFKNKSRDAMAFTSAGETEASPASHCYAQGLGRRLKIALSMHDLSQAELAKKVGVSPMEINHWVSGRREPLAGNLARMAMQFPRTRLDWLLTGENFNA